MGAGVEPARGGGGHGGCARRCGSVAQPRTPDAQVRENRHDAHHQVRLPSHLTSLSCVSRPETKSFPETLRRFWRWTEREGGAIFIFPPAADPVEDACRYGPHARDGDASSSTNRRGGILRTNALDFVGDQKGGQTPGAPGFEQQLPRHVIVSPARPLIVIRLHVGHDVARALAAHRPSAGRTATLQARLRDAAALRRALNRRPQAGRTGDAPSVAYNTRTDVGRRLKCVATCVSPPKVRATSGTAAGGRTSGGLLAVRRRQRAGAHAPAAASAQRQAPPQDGQLHHRRAWSQRPPSVARAVVPFIEACG